MDDILTPLECYIAQIGQLDQDLAAAVEENNQPAIDAIRDITEDTLDYIEMLREHKEEDNDDGDISW